MTKNDSNYAHYTKRKVSIGGKFRLEPQTVTENGSTYTIYRKSQEGEVEIGGAHYTKSGDLVVKPLIDEVTNEPMEFNQEDYDSLLNHLRRASDRLKGNRIIQGDK